LAQEKPRARQLGAAYIAGSASVHLRNHFLGKELTYRPLVYCWRGGQRSRSQIQFVDKFDLYLQVPGNHPEGDRLLSFHPARRMAGL
jgi:hypothetical protein